MTDEELIAWVRNGFGNVAADRIEESLKERDRYLRHLTAGAESLRRFEARAERLEAALREIIDEDQHQSEWRYWEKEDGHWARKARAALEPVAAPVMALLSDAEIASIMAEGPKGPPMLMPAPAAIREAALREAAALCFKNADGITEAVSAFPQIKKRRVLLQRAEQAKVDAAAILALIQKGGDACDKDDDPTNARPETSPGVTAGAISKGAAK